MVITLQAINARSEDTPHIHSIVVKIGDDVAVLDINGLLDTLIGTSMEELCLELESKYFPWTYTSAESAFKKISFIYSTMNQYVARGGSNIPSCVNRSAPQRGGLHHSHELKAATVKRIQMRLLGRSAILTHLCKQNQVLSVESLLPMLGAQHLD